MEIQRVIGELCTNMDQEQGRESKKISNVLKQLLNSDKGC